MISFYILALLDCRSKIKHWQAFIKTKMEIYRLTQWQCTSSGQYSLLFQLLYVFMLTESSKLCLTNKWVSKEEVCMEVWWEAWTRGLTLSTTGSLWIREINSSSRILISKTATSPHQCKEGHHRMHNRSSRGKNLRELTIDRGQGIKYSKDKVLE